MSKTWLAHHGILGQKWGVRRFQNKDGSLTGAGKKHYGIDGVKKDGYQKHDKPSGTITDGYQKHKKPIGTRKYKRGEKIEADSNDSSVTKKVKQDYNDLSDSEFMTKYQTSKNTYRKRVNKYGDPYMNSPLAKAAKSKAVQDFNNSKYGEHVHQKAHNSMRVIKTAQAVVPDLLAANATYKLSKNGASELEQRGHTEAAKALRVSGKLAASAFTINAVSKAHKIKKEFKSEKHLVGKEQW